jgi:aminoglycoside phosphotransferase (APT) family kinase protein
VTEFVPPFDLDLLEDGLHLTRFVEEWFGSPVESLSKVGQGFYAHVYQVTLEKAPKRVIVKCHKYAGRGEKEKLQLAALRKHAIVQVPQVYALWMPLAGFPGEALAMEYIPGVNASKIEFPDARLEARFVDLVVENLRAWHAVTHAGGFGELEGPFYETWLESFGKRIALYHEYVHSDEKRSIVSKYVRGVIDRSFEAFGSIFEGASQRPSLVHSDYNAWNMMVDPRTYALTGVIDPIDAGWSDYEIDLFHLANCRPDLRYRFYRFWDDVKHYLRMGWYGEERFRNYARELEQTMDACLT